MHNTNEAYLPFLSKSYLSYQIEFYFFLVKGIVANDMYITTTCLDPENYHTGGPTDI